MERVVRMGLIGPMGLTRGEQHISRMSPIGPIRGTFDAASVPAPKILAPSSLN